MKHKFLTSQLQELAMSNNQNPKEIIIPAPIIEKGFDWQTVMNNLK